MRYSIRESRLWEFADTVRPFVGYSTGRSTMIIAAAYATLLKQGWAPASGAVDEDISSLLSHLIPLGSPLDDALPIRRFSDAELEAIVMFNDWEDARESAMFTSADQIARIGASALGVDSKKSVADLCCGMGSFMRIAVEEFGAGGFYGRDIDYSAMAVAKMRASILGADVVIENRSITGDVEGRFDCIFLDGPLGMRPRGDEAEALSEYCLDAVGKAPVRSMEWMCALRCLGCLSEGGKIAAVMPGGPLFNRSDESVRKALVMGGMIECIIALPEKTMCGTSIPPYIVVISSGNPTVRLIDATDLGKRERRFTVLGNGDIQEILSRIADGGDKVYDARPEELSANKWALDPKRYVSMVELLAGVPLAGVPLGSLVSSIGRGGNISARELDERITSERTPFRYLMIKDVEDGEVSDDIPYLTEIREEEKKYCIKDGDIVLGKMRPFKSARVRIREGEMILCTGNLFIIRPDEDEIDPTYLTLFLASDLAISQLNTLCAGTTIPSVPIDALKTLQVPSIPIEEQRRIAREYEAIKEEIEVHRLKIERAKDRMAALLADGWGKADA